MSMKLLVFTVIFFGSSTFIKGENAESQLNPLATVTEMMVRFFPSMEITEFTCTTRYNVSKSQPLMLYYNDVEKAQIADANQLFYADEDAKPGVYKCKVGNDEAVFNLEQAVTALDIDIVELAFHANLVTEQVQIEYETVDPDQSFMCKQDNIDMFQAYHDIIAGIETQGYNGTAEPKIEAKFMCYVKNAIFPFSFTNNVEDLYPRISKFQVQVIPSNQGPMLNIFCQSRTVQNPTMMLFVNQFDLVVNKTTNDASYTVKYTDEKAFKCIVENKYGRDIISWGSGKAFTEVMEPGDELSYSADPNYQITEMIYKGESSENMNRIKCNVEVKNQDYQHRNEPRNDRVKVFVEAIDKFIVYNCRFKKGDEFKTALYTKEWLQPPKFDSVRFNLMAGDVVSNYLDKLYISCRESIKDSIYGISLFNGEEKLDSIKYVWDGAGRGIANDYRVSRINTAKCVIENDVGYAEFTMNYNNKIPKEFTAKFWAGFYPDGDIKSEFSYYKRYPYLTESLNCSRNGGPFEHKISSFTTKNKEQSGKFACNYEAWVYCVSGPGPDCYQNSSMAISWSKKSLSFIPDGSVKIGGKNEKFLSYFGFYNQASS